MKTSLARVTLWLTFLLLLGVLIYGFCSAKLFSQPIWAPEGATKLAWFAVLYWAGFVAVTLWKRSLAVPVLLITALSDALVCAGLLPFLAVLFFLLSSLVLGRSIQASLGRRIPAARDDEILGDLIALLVGLSVYMWVIGILVRYPVNYPAVYMAVLAVPIVLRFRLATACLRRWLEVLRPRELKGLFDQTALGLVGFVLLAQWLMLWKPEASADGLAMHLAIPAAIANFHRFPFDPRHVAWAVMPMNGDWGFTAPYLLGGEYAARLFNFSLFAVSAGLIFRAVRAWLPAGGALLIIALLASTPLVTLLSGSLMVENTWTVLLLGALVALALEKQGEQNWVLPSAAILCGTAVATKHGAIAYAAALAPVALLSLVRTARFGKAGWKTTALASAALFLLTAAPQYVYAYWKTGNPVFPFMNAFFKSPYFNFATSFVDSRFVTPLNWTTPYSLTFHSSGFMESLDGAMGFHYLLLFPIALVLFRRDWPYLAKTALWVSIASFLLVFRAQSNLRYAYPALVIAMLPIGFVLARVTSVDQVASKCIWGVAAIAVLVNAYFLPSAAWHHRNFFLNPLRMTTEADGYLKEFAPVRKLVAYANRTAPGAPVAFIESNQIAGLCAPAWTNSWHNEAFCLRLNGARSEAECFRIMQDAGVRYVIAPRPEGGLTPKQIVLSRLLDDYSEPEFAFGKFFITDLNTIQTGLRQERSCPSSRASLRTALPGKYDDFNRFVTFCGPWTRDDQFALAANGTLTYSDRAGASVHFTFEGSEVVWIYTKAFNRGIASVMIDGEPRGEIDLYSADTVWRARSAFGNLKPAKHIMVVRTTDKRNPSSSGGFVDVDALEVR